jgi:ABC-2 type transport system permease protein
VSGGSAEVNPAQSMPGMGAPAPAERPGPIADLSYRGYAGPLATRAFRWWTIALMHMQLSVRKWPFWVLGVLSAGGYLLPLIALIIRSQIPPEQAKMAQQLTGQPPLPWVFYFMIGLPGSLFFLLLLTLVIGAGSIAADNRANALLVYLSKPITKADYLIGKWVGVFVPIFLVAVLPPLVVYTYALFSFRAEGFFSSDPLLAGRVILVALAAAALHSSLVIAFSACTHRAGLAGALYGGFYFLTIIGALLSFVILAVARQEFRHDGVSVLSSTVGAMSVPGLIQGLAQHIYRRGSEGFDLTVFLSGGIRLRGNGPPQFPQPALWPVLIAAGLLIVVSLLVARARIRAVEVVRG